MTAPARRRPDAGVWGVRMNRRQIEEVVTGMAAAIAEAQGVEIVDVEFVREHGRDILRVSIDKPGGVGLDDCQRLSEVLSDRLDEVDPIPGPYALEVSSPGVERPLRKRSDYQRFAGRKVQIRTFAPIDGRRNWQGTLVGCAGDEVELVVDDVHVRLPFQMIARARLVADF